MDVLMEIGGAQAALRYTIDSMCAMEDRAGGALEALLDRPFTAARLLLWGGMIAAGKKFLWSAPSLIFVPGIAVMLTVICFNILGDKLRDILDPSLKD